MTTRQAFEAFISAPPFELPIGRFDDRGTWPGSYKNYDADLAWQAWKGATAAALAAPATAPEKTVQEIMEFARHYAANTFSSATLEDKIRRSLAAPATAPDLSAAYIGAREDLAIWKKRALEAEETARQLNRALAEEVNGPTFMGEPVLPATAPAQPAWHDAPTCEGMWLCDEGDENPYRFTCHDISMPLNPYLVGEGERWYGPIPEDKP